MKTIALIPVYGKTGTTTAVNRKTGEIEQVEDKVAFFRELGEVKDHDEAVRKYGHLVLTEQR